jgi:Tfp pilus assembly protein PilZ
MRSLPSLMHADRRAAPRLKLALTVHCRIRNRFARALMADLSSSGMLVRTGGWVQVGEPVRVAFAVPAGEDGAICALAGTVARLVRGERGQPRGVGVRFCEEQTAAQDYQRLLAFLGACSELSASQRAS